MENSVKPSVDDRVQARRAARKRVPRSSHADLAQAAGRPDPVELLEEQNRARVPRLVPLRHARMRVTPFTFYRGIARIMASDLAPTPTAGFEVQLGR